MNIFKQITHYVQRLQKNIKQLQDAKADQYQEIETLEHKVKELGKKEVISPSGLSVARILKFRVIGIILYYVSTLFFGVVDIIYLIITSYILSLAMESILEFFQKRGVARWFAIALGYFVVVTVLLWSLVFVIPFVLTQLQDLVRLVLAKFFEIQHLIQVKGLQFTILSNGRLPTYFQDAAISWLNNPEFMNVLQANIQSNIAQIINAGSTYATNIGNTAVTVVTTFFSALFRISLVMTMSILFSIEKEPVIAFIASMAGSRREYYTLKIHKLYKKLGFWLKSQMLLCVYIGIMVRIMLWLLSLFWMDIPNKWSLALISGLTEFIPYLWPILGAIPAVIVALAAHGFAGLVAILVLYFVIQWTENNIIIPVLMNKTLWISPIVVFVSMLVGWMILWVLGVILAIPIAVILSVMFSD